MRLFVAVDLSDELRSSVAAAMGDLRRAPGRAGLRSDVAIRWVAADHLHLTLHFLGHVTAERAAAIQSALDPPVATSPFWLELGGLGAFPESGAPRVLWIGVTRGAPELTRLYDEIGRRLEEVGHAVGARAFQAHLTVARFREPLRRFDRCALRAEGSARLGGCSVDHATLYESRLSAAGAVYDVLRRVPLAGSSSA